jgi:hypothetical protein
MRTRILAAVMAAALALALATPALAGLNQKANTLRAQVVKRFGAKTAGRDIIRLGVMTKHGVRPAPRAVKLSYVAVLDRALHPPPACADKCADIGAHVGRIFGRCGGIARVRVGVRARTTRWGRTTRTPREPRVATRSCPFTGQRIAQESRKIQRARTSAQRSSTGTRARAPGSAAAADPLGWAE